MKAEDCIAVHCIFKTLTLVFLRKKIPKEDNALSIVKYGFHQAQ